MILVLLLRAAADDDDEWADASVYNEKPRKRKGETRRGDEEDAGFIHHSTV